MKPYIYQSLNVLLAHPSDRQVFVSTKLKRLGTGRCSSPILPPFHFTNNEIVRNITEFNEVKRLRQRIAELESVIRELKKNPHPRWTAPGGIVYDPNFFDCFRRSTPKPMEENARLSFGEIVDDAASMGVNIKAEEIASCHPDILTSSHGIFSGPPRAHSPQLVELTVSRSGSFEVAVTGPGINPTTSSRAPAHYFPEEPFHNEDNPDLIFSSTSIMRQSATSNIVTTRNPFTTDSSGDSLPATPYPSARSQTYNHGLQTPESAPTSHKTIPQSSHKNPDPCNCLMDPMAFGPLLHLGISLRTSREALECLHPLSSDCMLYCHISMLEKHILCVPLFNSELSR